MVKSKEIEISSYIIKAVLFICLIGLLSCSSARVRRPRRDIPRKYIKYDGSSSEFVPLSESEGYLNQYIVDTLQIDTPVVVVTSNWHRMIMPYRTYSEFKGSEKDLYKREDVFFYDMQTGQFFPSGTDYQIMKKQTHPAYDIHVKTCPFPVCPLPTPKAGCIQRAYVSEQQQVDFYLVLITKQKFFMLFYDILHGDVYPELPCNDADYVRLLVPACK